MIAKPPVRRSTRARRTIADLIARRNGHFTAAELEDAARQQKLRVGRATIFRTLDMLTEEGALERLDLPSGEHAYVACEPGEHHHHVVCRGCGRSVEVADSGFREAIVRIGRQTGFKIENHRLELYGLCPQCAT